MPLVCPNKLFTNCLTNWRFSGQLLKFFIVYKEKKVYATDILYGNYAGDNVCCIYAGLRWKFLLLICWWIFLFQLCMWLFLLQAVRNFCSTYADDSFFGKYVGSNFYCNFADVSLCCNYTGGTFAVYCAPDCFYCNYKGDSFIAM